MVLHRLLRGILAVGLFAIAGILFQSAVATPTATADQPALDLGRPAGVPRTAIVNRPRRVVLDLWDNVLFGRYVAIDGFIDKYNRWYGINHPLWTTLAFAAESVMHPLTKGPLVDDRGIGQVGFPAERRGRERGTDPTNPDYSPDLDPDGSIWEPQTNIIFAHILFKWVYSHPQVNTPQKAYAVYTEGLGGLTPHGKISKRARIDIVRARSYKKRVLAFRRLVTMARHRSPKQVKAIVPAVFTRQLMSIGKRPKDGAPAYASLIKLYVRRVQNSESPWELAVLARESMSYADLGERVYNRDGTAVYQALHDRLVAKSKLFVGTSKRLRELYRTTRQDLKRRLAARS